MRISLSIAPVIVKNGLSPHLTLAIKLLSKNKTLKAKTITKRGVGLYDMYTLKVCFLQNQGLSCTENVV